jgi:glyoxylase-like metal-dependent hydrolase (beta-lactamase superfamily II)
MNCKKIKKIELPALGFPNVNSYIVGNTLIDTGCGWLHRSIILDRIGKERIKNIIITHAHPDHCGGLSKLKKTTFASIFASEKEAKIIQGNELREYYGIEKLEILWKLGMRAFFQISPCVVDRILRNGDEIGMDGFTMKVLSMPGHTMGHICLFLENEKILFSGDLIIGEGNTWIGTPSGDVGCYLSSLQKLSELDIKIIYPGHGPVVRDAKKRIKECRDAILTREKLLLKLLRKERTVSELALLIYRKPYFWTHASIKANIIHLLQEGKIREEERNGKVFYAATSSEPSSTTTLQGEGSL